MGWHSHVKEGIQIEVLQALLRSAFRHYSAGAGRRVYSSRSDGLWSTRSVAGTPDRRRSASQPSSDIRGVGYLVKVATAMQTIAPEVCFLLVGSGAELEKVPQKNWKRCWCGRCLRDEMAEETGSPGRASLVGSDPPNRQRQTTPRRTTGLMILRSPAVSMVPGHVRKSLATPSRLSRPPAISVPPISPTKA